MLTQPPKPSPRQKLQPRKELVKWALLSFFIAGFVLLKIAGSLLLPKPQLQASDLSPENILNSINKERQGRNLLTLNTHSSLSSAAQSKSDDMIARKYFSHTDPDGNYIWPKVVAAGYTPYLQLGENLAIEFYDTESLVQAWMNSPTHRANILNEGFKDQGMGLAFGNASAGEYHSAITNTFGSLAVRKAQAETPAPEPTPAPAPVKNAPAPTPAPAKPIPQPKPLPVPENPTPTTPATTAPAQASSVPISIRNSISSRPSSTTSPVSETPTSPPITTSDEAENAISGSKPSPANLRINRGLTLAFGLLLLLFLLTDLRIMLRQQIDNLDKKANNLTMLALAIIVIAALYWF